jgi:hypothetical protein
MLDIFVKVYTQLEDNFFKVRLSLRERVTFLKSSSLKSTLGMGLPCSKVFCSKSKLIRKLHLCFQGSEPIKFTEVFGARGLEF